MSGMKSGGTSPHASDTRESRRMPGRPRSTEADRAIADATLALLAEVGLGALSVEDVAVRAGVSKATIYRRFPSREALIVDSIAQVLDSAPETPCDENVSTRDILIRMVSGMRDWYGDSTNGNLMPRMIGYARTNPELFGCFYDRVIMPRREAVKAVLARGVQRGEVCEDIDLDLAVTMIVSPTLYLATIGAGGRDAAPGSTTEDVVDAVLGGLAPRTR